MAHLGVGEKAPENPDDAHRLADRGSRNVSKPNAGSPAHSLNTAMMPI
jgi:hypothetical protein